LKPPKPVWTTEAPLDRLSAEWAVVVALQPLLLPLVAVFGSSLLVVVAAAVAVVAAVVAGVEAVELVVLVVVAVAAVVGVAVTVVVVGGRPRLLALLSTGLQLYRVAFALLSVVLLLLRMSNLLLKSFDD
jgi:hypothetical protein